MTATNLTTLMRHRQTVCNANRITNAPAMNTIMEDELEYLYDYGRQIYDGDIRPTSSTSDVGFLYFTFQFPKITIIFSDKYPTPRYIAGCKVIELSCFVDVFPNQFNLAKHDIDDRCSYVLSYPRGRRLRARRIPTLLR